MDCMAGAKRDISTDEVMLQTTTRLDSSRSHDIARLQSSCTMLRFRKDCLAARRQRRQDARALYDTDAQHSRPPFCREPRMETPDSLAPALHATYIRILNFELSPPLDLAVVQIVSAVPMHLLYLRSRCRLSKWHCIRTALLRISAMRCAAMRI